MTYLPPGLPRASTEITYVQSPDCLGIGIITVVFVLLLFLLSEWVSCHTAEIGEIALEQENKALTEVRW